MGSDEGSSLSKAKVVDTSKANQGIHSPLPMDRQVFDHPQESQAPSHGRKSALSQPKPA